MSSPAPTPGVYRSRSKTTRQRVIFAGAGVALVLLGYAIGRLQGFDGPAPAQAAAAPSAAAETTPPAATETVAPPPVVATTQTGTDAYSPLQAEAAAAQQGTQSEDCTDQGGGKDVGFINNGDWLRFDNINFGTTAATKLVARVSSQSDAGGRMEIRLDTPSNQPVASLPMSNTGGWQNWQTRRIEMNPVTGLHTVFVTFANDKGDNFMNVNYFSFEH